MQTQKPFFHSCASQQLDDKLAADPGDLVGIVATRSGRRVPSRRALRQGRKPHSRAVVFQGIATMSPGFPEFPGRIASAMTTSAHKVMRQKCRRWLKRIERDVFDLLIARHIYEGIGAIVLNNRDIQRPGDVHSWMSRNYGTAIAIGIRRQADLRSDVTSLARLLKNIADNADAVTRESHVSHYSVRLRHAGDAWFDNFAGPARQALPSKIPSTPPA